jgi:hypothetical protein
MSDAENIHYSPVEFWAKQTSDTYSLEQLRTDMEAAVNKARKAHGRVGSARLEPYVVGNQLVWVGSFDVVYHCVATMGFVCQITPRSI